MDYNNERRTLMPAQTKRGDMDTTPYADLGPTLHTTSNASPLPNSKPRNVPARIKLLIADLGLRYRPTAAADMEAHAATLALLATDLADIPPDRLERAISTWVRAERWMPKASELVALCQRDQRRDYDPGYHPAADQAGAEAFASARNAGPMAKRPDIEWYVDASGEAKLRYKLDAEQELWKRDRVVPDTVPHLNRALQDQGSAIRFTGDGHAFDLKPGDYDPAGEPRPVTRHDNSTGRRSGKLYLDPNRPCRTPTRSFYEGLGIDMGAAEAAP